MPTPGVGGGVAWTAVLHGLLVFLPAYVANMSPVFVAKLVPRWSAPIDGGRTDRAGRRILGPGKTWRGLVGGAAAGAATALVVAWLAPPEAASGVFDGWDYGLGGHSGGPVGDACAPPCDPPRSSWWAIVAFGAVVGAAALLGDAVKSYFKRRRGKERGAPWFPFDQLDFVVFGLLGAFAAAPLLADGWVLDALLGDWAVLATIVVGTPALHLLVNRIGYWLGLKEVPW